MATRCPPAGEGGKVDWHKAEGDKRVAPLRKVCDKYLKSTGMRVVVRTRGETPRPSPTTGLDARGPPAWRVEVEIVEENARKMAQDIESFVKDVS